MAILVLSEHRFPTGELLREGQIFDVGNGNDGQADGVDFNLDPGGIGWDEDFEGRDFMFVPFELLTTTRNLEIMRHNGAFVTTEIPLTTQNATRHNMVNNGRDYCAYRDRGANPARFEMQHIEDSLMRLTALSDFDDANKDAGLAWDGRNFLVIDDGTGSGQVEQWRFPVADALFVNSISTFGLASTTGITYTGNSYVFVRLRDDGLGYTLQHRYRGKENEAGLVDTIASRSPSDFSDVQDLTWNGRNIYVTWSTIDTPSGSFDPFPL